MSNGTYLREYNEHHGVAITSIAMGHGLIVSGDEKGKVSAC